MELAHLTTAERALGEAVGTSVSLTPVLEFRPGRVARCHVSCDGEIVRSVIVKVSTARSGAPRDLAAHNEYAALKLLGEVMPDLAPALLGAEPSMGVLVLEDLGDGPSLATYLLGGDEQSAREGLVRTAATLGRLHAGTIGHAERFYEVRTLLGPSDPARDRVMFRGVDMLRGISDLPDLLSAHGLPGVRTAMAEFRDVLDDLRDPGAFLALSNGDPCPDNGRRKRWRPVLRL